MTPEFDLSEESADKPTVDVDDVDKMLHCLWKNPKTIHATGREMVQHGLLINVLSYIGPRVSTILVTAGTKNKPNSVRYKDVELFIVRDKNDPSIARILMKLKLRFYKGHRGEGTP